MVWVLRVLVWLDGSFGHIIQSSPFSLYYHVPQAKSRLVSLQRLFNNEKGVTGRFIVEEIHSTLESDGIGSVIVEYEDSNHFPITLAKSSQDGVAEVIFTGVSDKDNANLTPAQKLLLFWH